MYLLQPSPRNATPAGCPLPRERFRTEAYFRGKPVVATLAAKSRGRLTAAPPPHCGAAAAAVTVTAASPGGA